MNFLHLALYDYTLKPVVQNMMIPKHVSSAQTTPGLQTHTSDTNLMSSSSKRHLKLNV